MRPQPSNSFIAIILLTGQLLIVIYHRLDVIFVSEDKCEVLEPSNFGTPDLRLRVAEISNNDRDGDP